jgi:hypothetical protein
MQAPPTGWRPENVFLPSPPRSLPPQDDVAIDQAEARAAALTRAVAIAAGAIVLIMMCALCGRWVL